MPTEIEPNGGLTKGEAKTRSALKYLLIGACTVIIGLVVMVVVALRPQNIEVVNHASHVDWLPSTAFDISYARRGGFGTFLIYECNLPEADFQSLVKKEGWRIEEATNVQISGLRLVLKLPYPTNATGEAIYDLDRAFFFEQRYSNNGGTTVIYDRDRNRLFFSHSNR